MDYFNTQTVTEAVRHYSLELGYSFNSVAEYAMRHREFAEEVTFIYIDRKHKWRKDPYPKMLDETS